MSRTRLLCTLMLLTNAGCAAPPSTDDIQADVMVEFNRLVDAVRSVDAEAYYSFFDQKDFTAQFGGQTVSSFSQFKGIYDSYLPSLDRYLALEFPVVDIRVLSETTAVLINEYAETVLTTDGDTIRTAGSGTQVWRKNEEGWKLVHVAGSTRPAGVAATS